MNPSIDSKIPAPSPSSAPFSWAWISIPDHQGVVHVGGRIGAALGPAAAWRIFGRMSGRSPVRETLSGNHTAGPISEKIESNHREARAWVKRFQESHSRTVVVGGGHDLGFPHLQGVQDAIQTKLGRPARIGCINLDAHLDVRKPDPVITSGSPFYLALEAGVLRAEDFVEFGIQSHCNSRALWNFIEDRGVKVIPMNVLRAPGAATARFEDELKALSNRCDAIVVSLDLDCIEQASAPGVSAPQAEGFRPSDILEMVELSGKSDKVVSLGIFELNPLFDQDDRTARIAATAAWHFAESALIEGH